MAIRADLLALATRLRHAHTAQLPMDIAERMQHAIVRIEHQLQLASPDHNAVKLDVLAREAQALLDECDAFLKRL